MDHLDVQSRIGELVEADEAIEGLGMVFVNFLENLQRAFHLLRRRVVGNADVHGGFDVGPARNVGDGGIADRLVGNGDEVAVEIAYPRAAQADVLHDPMNGIERDAVPDAEWFVDEHCHGAEKIGHGVLRRQTERKTADGQAGDGGGDVEPEVLRSHEHGHNDDKDLECLADDGKELFVERAVGLRRGPVPPVTHQQVDEFEDGVSDGGGDDHFEALVEDLVDDIGPVENPQADVQEDDERDDLDRPVQKTEQQIVQLGFRPGGPFFEPDPRQVIEEFGDVEGQEDVN